MKRHVAGILVGLAALLPSTAAVAAPTTARVREVPAVLRLKVAGVQDAKATYWVAYGPNDGKFGIVRLRRTGSGSFVATQTLPVGPVTLTFLQGHGVLTTRIGQVPGNPVITIKTLSSQLTTGKILPSVQWAGPLG